jgi:hypothetical protein
MLFEGSKHSCSLTNSLTFEESCHMPWTHYQVTLKNLVETPISGQTKKFVRDANGNLVQDNIGPSLIMFTSMSTDGQNVTKITKYITTTAGVLARVDSTNISEATYNEWGWKLEKDTEGNAILPKFGDFTWSGHLNREAIGTNAATAGKFDIDFEFGFGLNGTCYNYHTEEANFEVFNISCKPKVFFSTDSQCPIQYSQLTKSWSEGLIEATPKLDKDGVQEKQVDATGNKYDVMEICGTIPEGSASKGYLFVCIEHGEQLVIDGIDNKIAGGYDDNLVQYKLQTGTKGAETLTGVFNDGSGTKTAALPFSENVPGEYTQTQITYDFYRIELTANPTHNDSRYTTKVHDKLTSRFIMYPQNAMDTAPPAQPTAAKFACAFDISLKLSKKEEKPTIRTLTQLDQGVPKDLTYTGTTTNNDINMIVTDDEAERYGLHMAHFADHDHGGIGHDEIPEYLENASHSLLATATYDAKMTALLTSALKAKKRSYLTDLEKRVDDAATSMKNNLDNYAYWLITRIGTTAEKDLGPISAAAEAARAGIQSYIDGTLASVNPSLAVMKSDDFLSKKFATIKTEIEAKETTDNTPRLPWTASNFNEKRSLNNLINLGGDSVNSYWKLMVNYNNWATKTVAQLRLEHLGGDSGDNQSAEANTNSPINFPLIPRSTGEDDQFKYNFKMAINPIDAKSMLNYLCHIAKFDHATDDNKDFHGLEHASLNMNIAPGKKATIKAYIANKNTINSLLYTDATLASVATDWTKATAGSVKKVFSDVNPVNTVSTAVNGGKNNAQTDVHFDFNKVGINDNNEEQFMLDHTESNPDATAYTGRWIYNKTAGTNPYAKERFPKEGANFRAVIKIPKSANGRYYDAFVNGVEVKEMMRRDNGVTYSFETDSMPGNGKPYPGRKTLINGLNDNNYVRKYNTVDNGIFQFVRRGKLLLVYANAKDMEYENGNNGQYTLPSIKIKERHSPAGKCEITYSDLNILVTDVCSTINLEYNTTAFIASANKYKGYVSGRYADYNQAFTVRGLLDCNETFTLTTSNDKYLGIAQSTTGDDLAAEQANVTIKNDNSNKVTTEATPFANSKYSIEYQEKGSSVWKSAEGKTFSYGQENFAATGAPPVYQSEKFPTSSNAAAADNLANDIAFISRGGNGTSSNIVNSPLFRIKLPVQANLLAEWNRLYDAQCPNAFGYLIRDVDINLNMSGNNDKLASTGIGSELYKRVLPIRTFVNSDPYQLNLIVKEINTATGLPTDVTASDAVATAQTVHFDYDTDAQAPKVTTTVTDIVAGHVQPAPPIATESIKFYKMNVNEDSSVVGQLSFNNFKVSGSEVVKARIVPLFKIHQDRLHYRSNGYQSGDYTWVQSATTDGETATNIFQTGGSLTQKVYKENDHFMVEINGDKQGATIKRSPSFNFEAWAQLYGHRDGSPDMNSVPGELLVIELEYQDPTSVGNLKYETAVISLTPVDVKEISLPNLIEFEVNEGEDKVDIASLFDMATIDGDSSNIKYYFCGHVMNGKYYRPTGLTGKNLAAVGPVIKDLDSVVLSQGDATGATDKANAANKAGISMLRTSNNLAGNDINTIDTNMNLKDCIIDGKFMIYHANYNTVNPTFDSWSQDKYGMVIRAERTLTRTSSSGIQVTSISAIEERATLVQIKVRNGVHGFRYNIGKIGQVEVVETIGNLEEGFSEVKNNPYVPFSDFTTQVNHEDPNCSGGAQPTIKYTLELSSFPSELEIYDGTELILMDDFDGAILKLSGATKSLSQLSFRLKNTNENKSMEGSGEGIALFAHYNSERRGSYNFNIKLSIDCSQTFLKATISTGFDALGKYVIKNRQARDVIADRWTTNAVTTNNDKREIYVENEDDTFDGPFYPTPFNFAQIMETRDVTDAVGTTSYDWAPLRTDDGTSYYTWNDFKQGMTSIPESKEKAIFPFSLAVKNSIDIPRTTPQAYQIIDKECTSYKNVDPEDLNNAKIIGDKINVNQNETHICYITACHDELTKESGSLDDVAPKTLIPDDHEDYPTAVQITADPNSVYRAVVLRTIPANLQMNQVNTYWQGGLLTGGADGKINGSARYGMIRDGGSNNEAVILDYFIEFHDSIDSLGKNETNNIGHQMGEPISYDGTTELKEMKSDVLSAIAGSKRRIYRCGDICRKKNSNGKRYTTGKVEFSAPTVSTKDKVLNFTIVAVTNMEATANDKKYNPNMVDTTGKFYETTPSADGAKAALGRVTYQPFQQYVYTSAGEKVVTKAFAPPAAGVSNTLLCFRTDYTVCTRDCPEIENGIGMFNTEVVSATMSGANIVPTETIIATTNAIRLFNIHGNVQMGIYNGTNWRLL